MATFLPRPVLQVLEFHCIDESWEDLLPTEGNGSPDMWSRCSVVAYKGLVPVAEVGHSVDNQGSILCRVIAFLD